MLFNISPKLHSRLLIILCAVLLGSCKKEWLDAKSDINLTIPGTLNDFELLLDNYEVISANAPALGEIAADGHYCTENAWSIMQSNNSSYDAFRSAYTWSIVRTFSKVDDWNNGYKRIFNANLALDGLSKIEGKESNIARFNRVKGNALFHRAKNYYDLVQIFVPPFKSGEDNPYGLPLKTGIDITEKTPRSSVKETYDLIISDLKSAIELLPIKPAVLTRASKTSCWALLARINLTIGDYENAVKYADSTLQYYPELMDFDTIPLSAVGLGLFNKEVIFHAAMLTALPILPNFSYTDTSLYELYHEDDHRKELFFNPGANGIGFEGVYSRHPNVNFSGLAVDEIYLIRAEGYARTSRLQLAMDDLNYLLKHRWKKDNNGNSLYIDKTASNETEALNYILEERRKELHLRGLRWSDIRRLSTDERFKITINRSIGGSEYTLEPNSYKYTFPIPDDERSLANIPQNPGWPE